MSGHRPMEFDGPRVTSVPPEHLRTLAETLEQALLREMTAGEGPMTVEATPEEVEGRLQALLEELDARIADTVRLTAR